MSFYKDIDLNDIEKILEEAWKDYVLTGKTNIVINSTSNGTYIINDKIYTNKKGSEDFLDKLSDFFIKNGKNK